MRKLTLTVLGLMVALGGYGLYIFTIAGQFKTITNQFAGSCTKVTGVVGGEDIVVHRATGQAFIAAIDRRALMAGQARQGAIWGYDLTAETAAPVNLTPDLAFDFSPHGIGLLPKGDGGTIMAVNHGGGGVFATGADTIEVFSLVNGGLKHIKTIKGAPLRAVNDVLPVGGGRFYATVDHRYTEGIMRTIEDYGRLALSSVVYFDGTAMRRVADGLRYANGINISPDGTKLYVGTTTDSGISVFDRDAASGALSNRLDVDLNTGVDNIDVDETGVLWIAAHAKLLDFVAHSKDAGKISASHVLTLTPKDGGGFARQDIYLNDGTELSGSSVPVHFGNRLLIGTVMDPHFLDCVMDGG